MNETRRVTSHNGRQHKNRAYGTGKVYSDKHNDRNYNLSHSDNIDITRTSLNEYWVYDDNVPTQVESELRDNRVIFLNSDNFNIHEVKQYEKMFQEAIGAQNKRNITSRHKERCKDIRDVHRSTQTCPEETLTYYGSKDNCPIPKELLIKMHDEIILEIIRRYGTNIKYLDSALHMDETGAAHFHDRRVWVYEGKDGVDIGQRKALQALGIKKSTKRVNTVGKEYMGEKYYNEKITFTGIERQIRIEIAKKYGFEIIEKPLEPGKYQKSQDRYIAEKEAERARLLTQAAEVAMAELAIIHSKQEDIVEATKEAMRRVQFEEKKLATIKDSYKTLSEVAEKRKYELGMLEEEKALQEKELNELRLKNYTEALSQKEYQKKQKELKKILKRDEPIRVTRYEYERLIAVEHIVDNLTKREKKLAESERNFASQVHEAVCKVFPKELQMAREDRAYCDEWLPKAREVEIKEKELLEREQTLEAKVEERAQDLFRELKEKFFEKMREIVGSLKNSVLSVLERILPKIIFKEINETLSMFFNNFENQIEIGYEEIDTEIDTEEIDF